MQRLWQFLLHTRTLAVLGFFALAAFLFVGADTLEVGLMWAGLVLALLLFVWLLVWAVRRYRAWRASQRLEQAIDAEAARAVKAAPDQDSRAEMEALRERMQAAVKTIKGSKLGLTSGSSALYELPWYAVIGNPAAGKSSAVVKSGLNFPFADKTGSILQGIGGTRNCDWFFTTEGILLDTAGRYSIEQEDRDEWLGFLSLLKRYRPKAPVNGVIIAASLAELSGNRPEFAITLAKQLRQRVQELTEHLEVFAPVYVMFTKADLISGFAEFFEDRDRDERDRVWGATFAYDTTTRADSTEQFDRYFDELHDGLKEASTVRMSMHRGEQLPPGVLTFPLEFAALKAPLRTFITTLFEENPYQFRPIFRGFYFTSAVQEGQSCGRASQRVAERFGLAKPQAEEPTAAVYSQSGFFLRELFSKVIFADRELVQQYTSRTKLRLRYLAFFGGALVLGAALAAWTWSYVGNRQLVNNVQADLNQVVKLQANRIDLQSRLEALEILQTRIDQLQRYREQRPWSLSLGLYQGEQIEAKLRREYFQGVQELMLKPAAEAIAVYLAEVNANAASLQPAARIAEATPVKAGAEPLGVYTAASATNVTDAYNALKTYIMLGERARMEGSHLSDQLTRFWRVWLEANRGTMPREQMIRTAEQLMSFSLTQLGDPSFPQLQLNLSLLDQSRENLRRVVRGMPARERVYAEVKARAATRFPSVTVARLVGEVDKDVVAGSHAISGTFTREAWDKFVNGAFKEAANKELTADDWVLKSAVVDDLTLEGSPEQIHKALVQTYKTEYVREWQRFMQGVSVQEFGSFDEAVARMNRLGDPTNSPVGKLMTALYDETSWDNPALLNERLGKAQEGFAAWFKRSVLRMAPASVNVNMNVSVDAPAVDMPMGPIGREFAGLPRLMVARENNPTLMANYLQALSKVRTRFNQIKTQGDPGPASRQLMQQTLEGGSELSEALKVVDEQMLNGMNDSAKATLRPLLVRPLMQAFAVIVRPAESEVNGIWNAQVHEPFTRNLAGKYPFDARSRLEATPGEMSRVFGPEGAIAKFTEQTLGTLVLRRGDSLSSRTWAEMGVRLLPEFTSGFSNWIAAVPGGSGGAASGGGAAAAAEPQTSFQILPMSAPGLTEFTLEIDGQQLRYRNTAASWSSFVWPGNQGTPGVKITGVTFDGRTVEFVNEPGRFGLEKMLSTARRRELEGGAYELTWPSGPVSVTVHLRLVSSTAPAPTAAAASNDSPVPTGNLKGVVLPRAVVGGPTAAAPQATAPSTTTASGERP